jgi:putative peptide zinc metalloprotease protein
MAQVRRAYPDITRRGAEVLQVTPTPPAQGALYTRRFDLPFPYLCDPGYTMYRRYGLASKGALAALRAVMESLPDVLQRSVTGEQRSLVPYVSGGLAAGSTEQGMFLIDRDRRVRFRHIADVHAHIPSNDTLLRMLDALS